MPPLLSDSAPAPTREGPRSRLQRLVHAQAFELTMAAVILFSLAAFSIGTIQGLPAVVVAGLRWIELLTVALFTLEYACRLLGTDRPWRYVVSFYGLVDLLAIAPYLLAGLDSRAVRILRLLRLVRVFKLVRYVGAMERLGAAARSVREELALFAGAATMLMFVAAVGIWHFEHEVQPEAFGSVFHGLWWAVVTLTTVGYGDAFPVTLGGRIFTAIVVLLGIGIVAVPTGLFASALSRASEQR